jgi:hypothetical protein
MSTSSADVESYAIEIDPFALLILLTFVSFAGFLFLLRHGIVRYILRNCSPNATNGRIVGGLMPLRPTLDYDL